MEKIRHHIMEMVKKSKSILLLPSAPADGDSLGSALALYLTFRKIGKEVTVVSPEPVPEAFQFLPTTKIISNDFSAPQDFIVTLDCKKTHLKTIRTKLEHDRVNIIITANRGQFSSEDVSFQQGPSKYDLIITVDTGDVEQLGRFYEDNTKLFTALPVINIDHHASNSGFGKLNYVDIMAAATTELLIPLILDFEEEYKQKLMDEDIATLLLAGIITDTGSFQNANTTPRAFAASAQLIKYGARQQEIIQHVFKTKQLSTLRLWGRILSKIKVDKKHRIVWSVISKKDFDQTQSRYDETGGIIDELLSNAPEAEVVLLLKQRPDNLISGSIRTTTSTIDASMIAGMFGGGGHVQAAGFKIESTELEKIEQHVIGKIQQFQQKRLNLSQEPDQESGVTQNSGDFLKENPALLFQEKEAVTLESEPHSQEKKLATMEIAAGTAPAEEKEFIPQSSVRQEEETLAINNGLDQKNTEESFTDILVKKSLSQDMPVEVELEPGVTYKFEE